METNKIYNENCVETMSKMPNEFIDLVVTSPPYDNLRKYKGFSFDFNSVAQGLFRVIKQGGVIVWIVSDATIKGSETGTSFKQALYFKELGLSLYDTMIWNKATVATPTEGRYFNTFEYMFIFCKGNRPKSINFICDRKNKTFGQKSKSVKRSGFENRNYDGESYITKEYGRRFNIWDIYPKSNGLGHPASFPEKLALDHIISWSNELDIVYDPFMGSGTIAKVCIDTNRKFLGSELSSEYCEMSNLRICS